MMDRTWIALLLVGACSKVVTAPSTREPAAGDGDGPVTSATRASTSASASTTSPPSLSPADAALLATRADKCLRDAECTQDAQDASASYVRADDAGAANTSCFRFYYGIGVKKDLPRARSCFERMVRAEGGCSGSSPDLERLFLASMLIDAQGGAADPTRAKSLFGDCFADVSVEAVLAETPRRAKSDPSRRPLDFCADIGGTTPTMGACAGIERDRVEIERARVTRLLLRKLDAEGRRLALRARDAWTAYAVKQGDLYGDKYRGGTLSSNASQGEVNALEARRTKAMDRLLHDEPTPRADPAASRRELARASRATCKQDRERARLCALAERAFAAYREAEVALYVSARGKELEEKDLTQGVAASLEAERAQDLDEVLRP